MTIKTLRRGDHRIVNSIGDQSRDTVRGRSWSTSAARLALAVIAVCLFLAGCNTNTVPTGSKPDSAKVQSTNPSSLTEQPKLAASDSSNGDAVEQVVRVKISRGPNTEVIEGTAPWTAGMTVFDAISALSPAVAVESTGQGEALFVKSIAGQANLGSAGDNWIYRVNGKLGDCSCGICEVQAGDEVVWSFGKYE